jgi:hypothetical protein
MLELEDFTELLLDSSLTGSSFGPEEDEESSPQATIQAIAATRMEPIAMRLQDNFTTNFFIKPSKLNSLIRS